MNQRQEQLLTHIVEDYIKTATPVGSDYLVKCYKLDVSGATVRNDCQVLEKEGYLTHPHTSAGRIPTENGYREYLESRIKNQELSKSKSIIKNESKQLEKVYKLAKKQASAYVKTPVDKQDQQVTKSVVKMLAELTQGAVMFCFNKRDVYYTGLSYLFAQPEFQSLDLVYNIGAVVDHLDDVIEEFYDELTDEVTVRIGSENPFSSDCSFISFKFKQDNTDKMLGILGPMRMDYLVNMGRLEYVRELLTS